MNNIISATTNRLDIKTFSAIQTVKYSLRAQKTTSLQQYHRDDILHSPVDLPLCYHMQTASGRSKKEAKQLAERRQQAKSKTKTTGPKLSVPSKPKQKAHTIHSKAKQYHQSMTEKRKAIKVLTTKRKATDSSGATKKKGKN